MEAELSSMKRRLILSFLFLIPLFYISMGHMMGAPLPAFLVGHENAISFAFTQLLLTLPILYINDKYYKKRLPLPAPRRPQHGLSHRCGLHRGCDLWRLCHLPDRLAWATGTGPGWSSTTWTCTSSPPA